MKRIRLSTSFPDWPLVRQTPGSRGVWGECVFDTQGTGGEYDYWVVYDDLVDTEVAVCDSQNTVFFASEPGSIRRYPKAFLTQFARVMTCQEAIKHPNVVRSQPASPWHVGRREVGGQSIFSKDYDELHALPPSSKNRLISLIVSDKTWTSGHRKRLRFVEELRRHFKSRLEIFGRGINEIPDKWDALQAYQYHVVLENTVLRDYWTEKLSDAYLARAFPFYYGCPNILDYFPAEAVQLIDIDQPQVAIGTIQRAIDRQTYEEALRWLEIARNRVLDDYNLFPVLARAVLAQDAGTNKEAVTLRPTRDFERRLPLPLPRLLDLRPWRWAW